MTILTRLTNANFDISQYTSNDQCKMLVCAIGYEDRSSYLIDKLLAYFKPESILCFFFDDYTKYPHAHAKYEELIKKGISPVVLKYTDYDGLSSALKSKLTINLTPEKLTVHVDYSSMPRSWYCRLPYLFSLYLRLNDQIFFWYTEGNYQIDGEGFPSAGINDFRVFSGKATLRANNNRSHIFGLGYDPIRVQAIRTVVDPNYLVVCYAFPSSDKDIPHKIRKLNEEIVSAAAYSFSLPLEDFTFSISKLCEVSNELVVKGDVVLIPNGPKPLILAASIVPDLVGKPGVVCMHVQRHNTSFTAINVTPTGRIYGFSFSGHGKNDRHD